MKYQRRLFFINDFIYTQSGKIKRNETLTLKPSFVLDL